MIFYVLKTSFSVIVSAVPCREAWISHDIPSSSSLANIGHVVHQFKLSMSPIIHFNALQHPCLKDLLPPPSQGFLAHLAVKKAATGPAAVHEASLNGA